MADPNKLDPKMVGQSILLDRLYPSSLPPEDMDRQAFLDEQNDRARQTFQTLSEQAEKRQARRRMFDLPGAFASGAEVLKAAASGWYTGHLEQAEQRQTAAQRGHTQDPLADVNLRMWQAAPMAAEVAASIASPVAGAGIDAKDFATAVEEGSPVGAALAGIGFVPGAGDVAKQAAKGMKKLVGEIDEARRRLTATTKDASGETVATTALPSTPDEINKAFEKMSYDQRGAPEEAMLRATHLNLAQIYGKTLEDAGDLLNRMPPWGGYGAVAEKVKRLDRYLNGTHHPPRGGSWQSFEDHLEAQLVANTDAYAANPGVTRSLSEQRERLREKAQKYADEHKKLPVYNEIHRLSNDLAIALGEQRFDDARYHLAKLKGYVDEGRDAWTERAMRVEPGFARKDYYDVADTAASAGARTVDEAADAAKQWQEKGVESPYFKRWFGDSKVVDEDGAPVVMYHGTSLATTGTEDFDVFQIGRKPKVGQSRPYVSLTTDPMFANRYAGWVSDPEELRRFKIQHLGRVYPVYAKVTRPFDPYNNADHFHALIKHERAKSDKWARTEARFLPDEASIQKWVDDEIADIKNVFKTRDVSKSWAYVERNADWIRDQGFDGFYVYEKGTRNLNIFDPTQVKSATGNVGTFDPKDPRFAYGAIPGAAVVRSQQSEEAE